MLQVALRKMIKLGSDILFNQVKIMMDYEKKYRDKGFSNIAGIDEAGRGPLAGPVVASAVILPETPALDGVRDSKKLTARKRELYYEQILEQAVSVGIGIVHEKEIDKINILQATYLAMRKAVGGLDGQPGHLLVDGHPADIPNIPQESIINGDDLSLSIASASIIAKVTRDRLMLQYDRVYPEYGFASNKGYGTKQHLEAIKTFGSTPIHRKSFHPVSDHLPTFADLKNSNKLGRLGEQLAAGGLIKLGYEILDINYSIPQVGEVDIIHREHEEIVFSEVKTQVSSKDWGDPLDQIDTRKRDKILEVAYEYLLEKDIDQHIRFDVISVQFFKGKPRIKRIKGGLAVD